MYGVLIYSGVRSGVVGTGDGFIIGVLVMLYCMGRILNSGVLNTEGSKSSDGALSSGNT